MVSAFVAVPTYAWCRYSTGQLVGFGFAGLFGLIILCVIIYQSVQYCKRRRTLNRLQSHYQLREPGAG